MAKQSIQIKLNEDSYNELVDLSTHPDPAIARRAKVILACADGKPTNQQVSAKTGMNPADVSHWRKQYAEHGIDGLRSRHGGGKQPAQVVPDIDAKIAELIKDKSREWTIDELITSTGATYATVSGVLRRLGITLTRTRWWNISTVDELIPKIVDICSLFISKNEQAIVVCCSKESMGIMHGRLSTRIRVLSEDFAAIKEPVSLANAIGTAAWRANKISAQTPIRIWDYLSETLEKLPASNDAEYHVFVCSSDSIRYNGNKLRGVYFHAVNNTEEWINQVSQWFDSMSDRHQPKAAEILLDNVRNYIKTANPESDPLLWDKVSATEQETNQKASGEQQNSKSKDTGLPIERLQISSELQIELMELLKKILPMQDLDSKGMGVCYIPVIYDSEQVLLDIVENHSKIPAADHFDFQNLAGVRNGIGEAEPVLANLRDQVGIRAFEMMLDLVKKKMMWVGIHE